MPDSKEYRETLEAYKKDALKREKNVGGDVFALFLWVVFSIVIVLGSINVGHAAQNPVTQLGLQVQETYVPQQNTNTNNTNTLIQDNPGYIETKGFYKQTTTRVLTHVEWSLEKGFHDVVDGTVTETHGYGPVVVK